MNADHEEAVEFAKVSKRENRVYVGNLSYEVKYRDLIEFMRGGGWGIIVFRFFKAWGSLCVCAQERREMVSVLFHGASLRGVGR